MHTKRNVWPCEEYGHSFAENDARNGKNLDSLKSGTLAVNVKSMDDLYINSIMLVFKYGLNFAQPNFEALKNTCG
mgnify:FL=1